ncbi:hypothetical protein KY084_14775 [Stakelama sp. CBK3Z-3]|uniref:Uncharacterized protein n=1 Tax=Stakelama flava TaxID=2860338 RepID=A0ABS6XQR0_9SPHN|nr:hypothetical protein [Stakelama flava]MBW4332128.1 hypothetical protein [Stakelama flava]
MTDAIVKKPIAKGKKGILLINRIGPSRSQLFIANADGSDERPLFDEPSFDCHGSFSPDGEWITFTSERNGDGQADIFRCRPDGSDVQPVVETLHVEDALVLSPDGMTGAYVSTEDGYTANIWVVDLASGERRKLTHGHVKRNDQIDDSPSGSFRPAWSPDGEWIAFSSDRDTAWYGHGDGHGWEHTQELSIYVMRKDGSDVRKLHGERNMCFGSPKWSPDGKRIVFYAMDREATWGARRPEWIGRVESQIVSVDFETGKDRTDHTRGPDLKLAPQYLPDGTVAYYIKAGGGGPNMRATDAAWVQKDVPTGLYYTDGRDPVLRQLRSPCWSADGSKVIYEKVDFTFRGQGDPLYSWDDEWEYRHTDVFPVLSRNGRVCITEKQQGCSSVVTCKPDGSDKFLVFDASKAGLDPIQNKKGLAGAFQPSWSPDEQWIAFGIGAWFDARSKGKSKIMRAKSDGSYSEDLTDGTEQVGFPSYSADGKSVVYRVWEQDNWGLRIVDVDTKEVRVLTTEIDNLPSWSPDGERITFTREYGKANYHVCTIRPDGSDFQALTETGANDGHSIWTYDGRIAYSTGMYGFRDEAAIYDFTFQPYGQIMVMDADGSNKRLITDSLWEDSMPCYIPNKFL